MTCRLFILAMWLIGSSLAAQGQVLRKIDPSRQADVNGKVINSSSVDLKNFHYSLLPQGTTDLSGRRVVKGTTDTRTIDLDTRVTVCRSFGPNRPQQNFAAKRSATSDRRMPARVVDRTVAPIKDRTIHAMTPTGEAELKQQLNKPMGTW